MPDLMTMLRQKQEENAKPWTTGFDNFEAEGGDYDKNKIILNEQKKSNPPPPR